MSGTHSELDTDNIDGKGRKTLQLHLEGTPDEIIRYAESTWRGVVGRWDLVYNSVRHFHKREILDHEAIMLMAIIIEMQPKSIFEIGTCWGYSAAVMAAAAPGAHIVTCVPKEAHVQVARENLRQFPNVTVAQKKSQDIPKGTVDFIFVDGDHNAIEEDLLWWDYAGFMLFHDYSPDESARPCRVVYDALKGFRPDPDILIVDNQLRGMIGWENVRNHF
jgi:hypothetical protein